MSVNFSANQYEQAFEPERIQNWEVPKGKGKYPLPREGSSVIHANNRGHLLPNVPRRRESPWGTYVGTWDMPTQIPGNRQVNPTARCEDMQLKLQVKKEDAAEVLSGGLKKSKVPSPLPVKVDEEAKPINNPPMQPGSPFYATATHTLQAPTLPMMHDLSWPKHRGDADQPVGNAASPKPPTPMPLGGENVQAHARNIVSPVNPEQVAVRGAVATPIEPVTGQLRTLEANVNWPMARSAEPEVL
ncbi:hypothetical protein ACOMHN_009757 [Nucella lapillus]